MPLNEELSLELAGASNIKGFIAPIVAPVVEMSEESGFYTYGSNRVALPTRVEMLVADDTRGPSSNLTPTTVTYTTEDYIRAARLTWKHRDKLEKKGISPETEGKRLLMNEVGTVTAYWDDALNDLIRAKYTAIGHAHAQSPSAANQWVRTSAGGTYVETDLNTLIDGYISLNGNSKGIPTIFGDFRGIDIGINALIAKYGSESTLDMMLNQSLADNYLDVVYRGVRWVGTRATTFSTTYKHIWDAGTNTKQLFFTFTQANPLDEGTDLSYAFTATKPPKNSQRIDGLPWVVNDKPPEMPQDTHYWQAITNFGVNAIKDTCIFIMEGPGGSTYDLWA